MKRILLPSLLLAALLPLHAAPFTEARISRIINDVSVLNPPSRVRAATLNEVVKDDMAVKTGIKSRSELLFQDNTLTRLGPESFFSFKPGTRDMTLEQGTMLLQVPKGHGGAKIRTAAVTAAITGTTIMLEHVPGKTLKVLVLEGSLRLSINGRFGDSLLLRPGKMVIMPPNAKRIPDPVSVDLAKVMKTSSLVNMDDSKQLPSAGLIGAEIATQARSKATEGLVDSNLVILGSGSRVVAAGDEVLAAIDRKNGLSDVLALDSSSRPPEPTEPPTATPSPNATPAPAGQAEDDEPDDDDDPNYDRVVEVDTTGRPSEDVNLDDSVNLSNGGKSGKLNIHTHGTVAVNSSIKVSESAAPKRSGRGGKISIESKKTSGDAITVSSSGELLSLLDASKAGPGGSITFKTSGGAVNVNGGKLQADRGKIDIRTHGDAGAINLTGATLNASTIKLRTYGNNGQLNIGGGRIDADTLISLYAGGSNGQVNFIDDVTLSGTSVKNISGNAVTVRDGKIVNVQGPSPANIFTNQPNYTGFGGNSSTTGTFSGAGANTQPLASSPGTGR